MASPMTLENMNIEQFEETLVNAIHSKQLRTVLSKLQQSSQTLPDDALEKLRVATEAVKVIDDSTLKEMGRVCDLLETQNVPVLSAEAAGSEEILHVFKVSIDEKSLEEAAGILEGNGYFTPLRSSPSFWKRYTKFFNQADFSTDQRLPFRVSLGWQSGDGEPKKGRRFRPGVEDLKAIDFPGPLWPAYYGVKLVRRLLSKSGRKEVQNLGPFLGTPAGMIGPLLKFANLKNDHQLVDIGCGDGRILLKAATDFGCRVVGYETDDSLLRLAASKVKGLGYRDLVTLLLVDANRADVSDADVVFVFLPANVTGGIVSKLLPKMKSGAVLIAHEQHELKTTAKPTEKMPLILPCGISVAYKWQA